MDFATDSKQWVPVPGCLTSSGDSLEFAGNQQWLTRDSGRMVCKQDVIQKRACRKSAEIGSGKLATPKSPQKANREHNIPSLIGLS